MASSEIQQHEEAIVMQVDTAADRTTATITTTTVVNRIPSTASSRKRNKRRHSFGSKQSGSNDGSTVDGSLVLQHQQRGHRHHGSPKRYKALEVDEEVFNTLDPSHPEHARRIFQRHKAISKGKNTVGYQQYVQQVPKHQRHPRSMKTPSTPDPSLDIPAKRWQGLVKAWRIALHDYDPPELVNTTVPAATNASKSGTTSLDAPCANTASRTSELDRAAAMGVLVDLDDRLNSPSTTSLLQSNPGSPISVLSDASPRRLRLQDLDDNAGPPPVDTSPLHTLDFALDEVDSDSDDELL